MKYTLFSILALLSLLLAGCRESRKYGGQTANQSTLVKQSDSIAADSLRIYTNRRRAEIFSHKVSVYRLTDTSKRHFVEDTACRKITIFYNGHINGYKVKVTARAPSFHEINTALLVFNSHLEGGRDNHACFVYSVSKKEFLTTPPFNLLTSGAEYDFEKKTITMFFSGGANLWTNYIFKFVRKASDPSKLDFYLEKLEDCDDPTISTYLYNSKGALVSEKHEFLPK